MKQIYRQIQSNGEILNTYLTNPSVNFLAFAVTPWQAHGIDICINELYKKKFDIDGLIIICAHNQTGFCVHESHFQNLKLGKFQVIEYPLFKKNTISSGLISYFLFTKRRNLNQTKFIINPFGISYDLAYGWFRLDQKCKIVNILTDEGLGIYFRSDKNWILENGGKLNLKSLFIQTIKQKIKDVLINQLNKNGEFYSGRIFEMKQNQKISPSKAVVKCYLELFESCKSENLATDYKQTILINTQAFYLDHQDCGDFDIECLSLVCHTLKNAGYSILLKPHPREKTVLGRYHSLGVQIDDRYEMSQELLLAKSTHLPLAILGFYSTTLITANLLWNIPAICLNSLAEVQKADSATRLDMESFSKRFSDFICEPKTVSELIGVIES